MDGRKIKLVVDAKVNELNERYCSGKCPFLASPHNLYVCKLFGCSMGEEETVSPSEKNAASKQKKPSSQDQT